MKATNKAITLLIAGACAGFSTLSQSAQVTVMGDDLIFTYDDSTQFGTANVVGNSIFFLPTNFIAQSLNGNGGNNTVQFTDFVDIDIQIKAESNALIDSFILFESGDYKLVGSGTSAIAQATLEVESQTHSCGGPGMCTLSSMFSSGPLSNQSGALELWNINGTLDLDNESEWADDFHVNLRIENTLYATSTSAGESALVQKKFGAIGVDIMTEVVVAPVPVPAAAWFFASALITLVVGKRRG